MYFRTFVTILSFLFTLTVEHSFASDSNNEGISSSPRSAATEVEEGTSKKVPTKINFTLQDLLDGTFHRNEDGQVDMEATYHKGDDGQFDETKPKRPFKTILHETVLKEFTTYWSIMFREDFPAPKHPLDVITYGFRCLYDRIEEVSKESATEEEKISSQDAELQKTLALHKTVMSQYIKIEEEKTLVTKIADFACEACRNAATYMLGVHKN